MMPHHASSFVAGVLCALPVFSRAQQPDAPRDTVYQMSPVVVTATQARERETPVTFSNLTAAQIRSRYTMQDIPVLLSELPSITTYSENGNGIGYNYVTLRGFDQRRISVMINGIPQNDPEDHNVYWLDFPDLLASVGNVQVQRGAGSAFYGPAAIGGSINLVTNPFNGDPGIVLESYFGFQEFGDSSKSLPLASRKLSASFRSGLVGGQYMFYGRLGTIGSSGYRTNSWVNMDSYFFGAMRIDGDMTTRFHFFGGPITDGLAYNGLPKFAGNNLTLRRQNLADWTAAPGGTSYADVTPRRPQESEAFSQPHYEVLNDWKISSSAIVYNTLFYYEGDGYFDYDASWADTTNLRLGNAYGIPVTGNPTGTIVRAFVGNHQWGWLPRVEVDHGDGSLTVGAEFRFHRSTHWGKIQSAGNLPAGFDPDYHFYEYNGAKDILSLYGHEIFHLTDVLSLMGSAQFVWNRYRIENEKFLGNSFSVPYIFVNPRGGLNYNINENANVYLSFGYTSREPQLRNLYAAEDAYFGATPQFRADTTGGKITYDFTQPLAKPERLFNVELGAHHQSTRFQGGASIYWMEFTDELVKSGQVDIFGQPVTGNAERSRHVGIEIEGMAALPFQCSVSANATFSMNRLVRYSVIDDSGNRVTLDGNPVAGFPDVLGNLRLTYDDGIWSGSVAARYVGPFYTDNDRNVENRNDAYTVCNAEFLYRIPFASHMVIELRGEVRNVFNSLYFMNGEGNAFFPAAERNYLIGTRIAL